MGPTSYQAALPRDKKETFETLVIHKMAEELGFEPRRHLHDLPVFKTGPFNHLGIPPLVDPEGLEPSTGRLWADSSNRLS